MKLFILFGIFGIILCNTLNYECDRSGNGHVRNLYVKCNDSFSCFGYGFNNLTTILYLNCSDGINLICDISHYINTYTCYYENSTYLLHIKEKDYFLVFIVVIFFAICFLGVLLYIYI